MKCLRFPQWQSLDSKHCHIGTNRQMQDQMDVENRIQGTNTNTLTCTNLSLLIWGGHQFNYLVICHCSFKVAFNLACGRQKGRVTSTELGCSEQQQGYWAKAVPPRRLCYLGCSIHGQRRQSVLQAGPKANTFKLYGNVEAGCSILEILLKGKTVVAMLPWNALDTEGNR